MTVPAAAEALRFGRFEIQAHERRLLADGVPLPLGDRALELLLALAQRPGQLVSKHALMDLVWPGLVVQENNLAAQMSTLRKVVGEGVVATIPGRGYRFVARLLDEAPAEAAARPSAPALRTNLPVPLPPLRGREDDLARAAGLVETARLVTITGAGGMGKSLLAQHVLDASRSGHAQGVCWVELAPLGHGAALPAAVATALGVDLGRGEPLAALCGAIAPLDMLVALDNAEHLLADVAELARALLTHAPGLRLLVTSQVPLKVAGERVLRLGSLALPERDASAAQALSCGAVALFAERAQAVDARFELTDTSAAIVAEICRRLDGMPLAIELAAARVPLLGLPRLLASMTDRLKVLTAGRDRHAPERQRTLRAALAWSHDLLDAREQRALRRFAVVAGSASLDLLQSLLSEGSADGDALEVLDALVERSLVVVVARRPDETPRYRLPESAREFALEKLDEAGECAVVKHRHAQAVSALFDAAYDAYFDGCIGVDDWLLQMEPDLDNAREAMAAARELGDTRAELTTGATLLRALPYSAHVERLALADAVAASVVSAAGESQAAALRVRVWTELACVWSNPSKARALDASQKAVELARTLASGGGDRFPLCHALARAASAAAQADQLASARLLLQEARSLEQPAWPAHRRLWCAEAGQWIARMAGDVAEALRCGRELLVLDQARGSDGATALGNLVDAELAAGDAAAAVVSGTELVERLRATRHEYSLAFARINLAAALLALDDTARAREVLSVGWETAPAFQL
jgi:predicted ATPase/DNA-binding winged helix-turn-helix (wHTH) protein